LYQAREERYGAGRLFDYGVDIDGFPKGAGGTRTGVLTSAALSFLRSVVARYKMYIGVASALLKRLDFVSFSTP